MQPLSGLTEEVPQAGANVNLHTFNHSNSSGILRMIEDPLRLGHAPGGPVSRKKTEMPLQNRRASKNPELKLPKKNKISPPVH
mmetsp:Transcript_2060/g.3096  ORF Transcript_2060/g.3096 Transcript_2060/m.3096 type:complete len:83 (-) Transcript_2060:1412-1660(-)